MKRENLPEILTSLVLILVLATLVCCLSYLRSPNSNPAEFGGVTLITASTVAPSSSPVGLQRPESKQISEPAGKSTVSKGLSPAMERQVSESFNKAETQLREFELKNTSYFGRIEGTDREQTFMLISQPTTEQYAEFSRVITEAFKGLPPLTAIEDRKLKLMNRFTAFPAPYKLINRFQITKDVQNGPRAGTTNYTEQYVVGPEYVTIDGQRLIIKNARGSKRLPDAEASKYEYLYTQQELSGAEDININAK